MAMPLDAAASTLAELSRHERTRLIATVARRFGLDLAEEAVDAAFSQAVAQWIKSDSRPEAELPASPRAWLLAVARRRAIDRLRHRAMADESHRDRWGDESGIDESSTPGPDESDERQTYPDDRLRLLFTCCHPALARETQVALALRWLSGLSTEEVARAFGVPIPTMAQRLTRAKSKIEASRIPYQIPSHDELDERVSVVLEVLYSMFNEGYVATTGDVLSRPALLDEAMYLAELVVALLPSHAEPPALLALLLLIDARHPARVSPDGELVPLHEQDRRLWNRDKIARGKRLLFDALDRGRPTAYAIEASIQALHDDAPAFEATDFAQLAELYRLLRRHDDAPAVRINEAIALGSLPADKNGDEASLTRGPTAALRLLDAIEASASVDLGPTLWVARAEMHARLGHRNEARSALEHAISRTKNAAEARYLRRRLGALDVGG